MRTDSSNSGLFVGCRNPFFWMSLIMMGTTMAAIGLRIHNVVELSKFVPANVAPGSDAFGTHFAQLQGPAARVRVERSLMALLSFCVWLRVFKYTRRVPVFGTIGRTMTRAFPAVRFCFTPCIDMHAPHA